MRKITVGVSAMACACATVFGGTVTITPDKTTVNAGDIVKFELVLDSLSTLSQFNAMDAVVGNDDGLQILDFQFATEPLAVCLIALCTVDNPGPGVYASDIHFGFFTGTQNTPFPLGSLTVDTTGLTAGTYAVVIDAGFDHKSFVSNGLPTEGLFGVGTINIRCDPILTCSGNGICDPETDECICDSGWSGVACDVAECDPACVNGECVEPDLCVCDEGWVGDDCSVPVLLNPFMDVRPGACPNRLTLDTTGKLPVLLIGTAAFEVRDVDLDSLRLRRGDGVGLSITPVVGPDGIRARFADESLQPHAPCDCGNAGQDDRMDVMIKFHLDSMIERFELAAEPVGTRIRLRLTGTLKNGAPFLAQDCLRIAP